MNRLTHTNQGKTMARYTVEISQLVIYSVDVDAANKN